MKSAVAERPMRKEKKPVAYQIRCSREWIDRVEKAATAAGMPSAAAYIRWVINSRMDHDGVPPEKPKK